MPNLPVACAVFARVRRLFVDALCRDRRPASQHTFRAITAGTLSNAQVQVLLGDRAIVPVLTSANKPEAVPTDLLGVSITLVRSELWCALASLSSQLGWQGVLYTCVIALAICMLIYGLIMRGPLVLIRPTTLQRVALGGLGLVRALYFFLVAGGVLVAGRPENLIVASLATPMLFSALSSIACAVGVAAFITLKKRVCSQNWRGVGECEKRIYMSPIRAVSTHPPRAFALFATAFERVSVFALLDQCASDQLHRMDCVGCASDSGISGACWCGFILCERRLIRFEC